MLINFRNAKRMVLFQNKQYVCHTRCKMKGFFFVPLKKNLKKKTSIKTTNYFSWKLKYEIYKLNSLTRYKIFIQRNFQNKLCGLVCGSHIFHISEILHILFLMCECYNFSVENRIILCLRRYLNFALWIASN